MEGGDVAALLVIRGPPEVVTGPDPVQRAAGALRAGLRSAVLPLAPDPRALLPGLVVGEDPESDAKRFRTTERGINLITQAMIDGLAT